MRIRNRHVIAVMAGLFCFVAPAQAQLLRSQIFVESEILGIPNMVPTIQAGTGPLTDSFDYQDLDSFLPDGVVSISTEVDYGICRLGASMDVRADAFDRFQTSIDSGTRATGSFSDTVTINAPGLSGMAGSFVPVIDIRGSLVADAAGEDLPFVSFASAGVTVTVTPGSQQRFRSCDTTVGTGAACFFGDALGTHVLNPIPFTFGSPFTLGVGADAATFNRTVPSGTSFGDADFLATIRWLGFQNVLDAGQAPVANFSVTSGSGVDWSQPVPEAGAGGLSIVAIAALIALGRRSRELPVRHQPTR